MFRADISLPNFGTVPGKIGLVAVARAAVEAGFDGLWVSDHVILVEGAQSRYPFHPEGRFVVSWDDDWYDALITLAYVGSQFPNVELGITVLIAALRNPIELAKQLATLDQLTLGRLRLGLGAGWLREEFEALGVPFGRRGERLDAVIEILKACWTGTPMPGQYGPYVIANGIQCKPVPVGEIPLFIGGTSDAALSRAARCGQGWHGIVPVQGLHANEIRRVSGRLRRLCLESGRSFQNLELSLRISIPGSQLGTDELVESLSDFVEAGVSRFVIDIGWRSLSDGQQRLQQLKSDLERVRRRVTDVAQNTKNSTAG